MVDRWVGGKSKSLIAFDCNVPFFLIRLSIFPFTTSPTPSLHSLLVIIPSYPASSRPSVLIFSRPSKQSESKPPYLLECPPRGFLLSEFVPFHIWLLPATVLSRKGERHPARNSGAVTRRLRHARPETAVAIAWCRTCLC